MNKKVSPLTFALRLSLMLSFLISLLGTSFSHIAFAAPEEEVAEEAEETAEVVAEEGADAVE